MRDVVGGWFLRRLHANGASFFFMAIYLHIGRGIYFGSYTYLGPWLVGVLLLLASMAAAFLGYTLPWGQMRFWGATVITSLLRAFPYFGADIVSWLWGGFCVDSATLSRFYTFHFLLPFAITALSGLHIFYLHLTFSNNPLGISSSSDNLPFHSFFTYKDIFGIMLILRLLLFIVFFFPYLLFEADNFIPANALVTPSHIVPEWYFLFAYAILRCIPSKFGGVLGLFCSILILVVLPFTHFQSMKGLSYYGFVKLFFWVFCVTCFLLTLAGAWPAEVPFTILSRVLSFSYFSFFFLLVPLRIFWDFLLQ